MEGRGQVQQRLLRAAAEPFGHARRGFQAAEAGAEVLRIAQREQALRGFVEPDDVVIDRIEHDDRVGQGRGGLAERAQAGGEAALARARLVLAAVQLFGQLCEQAPAARRRHAALGAQQAQQARELPELPARDQRERQRQRRPEQPEHPSDQGSERDDRGHAPGQQVEAWCALVRLRLHALRMSRRRGTGRGQRTRERSRRTGVQRLTEKRYPLPRTVCTRPSRRNGSRVLRRRRMCTSTVRSST